MFGSLMRRKAPPAAAETTNPPNSKATKASLPELTDAELVLLSEMSRADGGCLTIEEDVENNDGRDEGLDTAVSLEQRGLLAVEPLSRASGKLGAFSPASRTYRITPAGLDAIGLGDGPAQERIGDDLNSVSPEDGGSVGAHEAGIIDNRDQCDSRGGNDGRSRRHDGDGDCLSDGDVDSEINQSDGDRTESLTSGSGSTAAVDATQTTRPRRLRAQSKLDVLPRPGSVETRLLARLSDPAGVTIAELCHETGWQSHSLRAVLSRLRSKGTVIARSTIDGRGTVYRLGEGLIDVAASTPIDEVDA